MPPPAPNCISHSAPGFRWYWGGHDRDVWRIFSLVLVVVGGSSGPSLRIPSWNTVGHTKLQKSYGSEKNTMKVGITHSQHKRTLSASNKTQHCKLVVQMGALSRQGNQCGGSRAIWDGRRRVGNESVRRDTLKSVPAHTSAVCSSELLSSSQTVSPVICYPSGLLMPAPSSLHL